MILRPVFSFGKTSLPVRPVPRPLRPKLALRNHFRVLAAFNTKDTGDYEVYDDEDYDYENVNEEGYGDVMDDEEGYADDEGNEPDATYNEAAEDRCRGVVKWFDNKKGFGFIQQDDGSGDIFVHQTNIQCSGYRSLRDGEAVEYEVVCSSDGRLAAVAVTGPDGQDPLGSREDSPFLPAQPVPSESRYSSEPNTELSEYSSGLQLVAHNIPWSIKDDDLQDFFEGFDPISCEVRYDDMGRSRGFGTARFSSKEDATRAIMALHNTNLGGRSITVRFDRYG